MRPGAVAATRERHARASATCVRTDTLTRRERSERRSGRGAGGGSPHSGRDFFGTVWLTLMLPQSVNAYLSVGDSLGECDRRQRNPTSHACARLKVELRGCTAVAN